MLRRPVLLGGLIVIAAAGLAYGVYRFAKAASPQDPAKGLTVFSENVKQGMATREAELRDALGLDVGVPEASGPGDGRGVDGRGVAARHTGSGLSAEEARELLRDPAGPRPERATEGPDGL